MTLVVLFKPLKIFNLKNSNIVICLFHWQLNNFLQILSLFQCEIYSSLSYYLYIITELHKLVLLQIELILLINTKVSIYQFIPSMGLSSSVKTKTTVYKDSIVDIHINQIYYKYNINTYQYKTIYLSVLASDQA